MKQIGRKKPIRGGNPSCRSAFRKLGVGSDPSPDQESKETHNDEQYLFCKSLTKFQFKFVKSIEFFYPIKL